MNIVLCGFKNCGKTTYGKRLAKELGREFFDIDDIIVEQYLQQFKEKLSIREIYAKIGNDEFRRLEKEVAGIVAKKDNAVIAAGGGTVMDPDNVKMLKKFGRLIFLRCPKETIKERIFKGGIPAFIDADNPYVSFEKIYNEREKQYLAVADEIIETHVGASRWCHLLIKCRS
ncbi:MAG: shikimate kinase [Gammaproteobacteria bacterium]|nr:shikimate kinase [Gammaproteobacteria bacterium]